MQLLYLVRHEPYDKEVAIVGLHLNMSLLDSRGILLPLCAML